MSDSNIPVPSSTFLTHLMNCASPRLGAAVQFRHGRPQPQPEIKDNFREIVETVVFVVVLVLLLKSFVAEALSFPPADGRDAVGYQKLVDCPKCHYNFPVNCSSEVDPPEPDAGEVTGCTCPNCRKFHSAARRWTRRGRAATAC